MWLTTKLTTTPQNPQQMPKCSTPECENKATAYFNKKMFCQRCWHRKKARVREGVTMQKFYETYMGVK